MKHSIKKLILFLLLAMAGMGNTRAQVAQYESVLKADSTSWISYHRELEFTMKDLAYVKNANGTNCLVFVFGYGYGTYIGESSLVGTLREEDGRLWITYTEDPDNEFLLMDMNLEVGDEFVFSAYYTGTVVEVRYEDGRKIIVFDRPSYNWYQEPIMFIEGVGRNIMTFDRYGDWDRNYQPCKYDGSEWAYSTPNHHFTDCEIETVSVDENGEDAGRVEIHPNPTDGQVDISGTDLKSAEVYNAIGQHVASAQADGGRLTVDLSGEPAGVYFVSVTDTEGRKSVRKVVKR